MLSPNSNEFAHDRHGHNHLPDPYSSNTPAPLQCLNPARQNAVLHGEACTLHVPTGCNVWQWQLPILVNRNVTTMPDNFLLEDSTRYFLAERSRRTPQNDCHHRNSPVDVLPFHANLSTKASNGILPYPTPHVLAQNPIRHPYRNG